MVQDYVMVCSGVVFTVVQLISSAPPHGFTHVLGALVRFSCCCQLSADFVGRNWAVFPGSCMWVHFGFVLNQLPHQVLNHLPHCRFHHWSQLSQLLLLHLRRRRLQIKFHCSICGSTSSTLVPTNVPAPAPLLPRTLPPWSILQVLLAPALSAFVLFVPLPFALVFGSAPAWVATIRLTIERGTRTHGN